MIETLELPEKGPIGSSDRKLEFLTSIVRSFRPTTILETGTYRGRSALAMAAALRENGDGFLFTCDPHNLGARELIERNELEGYATYLQVKGETLAKLLTNVELAYIDCAWRTREPTFQLVRERLAPGGIIIVDDVNHPHWSRDDGEDGASRDRIVEHCVVFPLFHGLAVYLGPSNRLRRG